MVEFSMLASNDKTHEDDNTFPINNRNRRILKSAAVYGANGSGKTNFSSKQLILCEILY